MADELFDVMILPFAHSTELQRQVLATFAFGMVYHLAQLRTLTPAEVHALSIAMLMDVFRYSDHQAVSFTDQLISVSADATIHATMNAIIHRGIDGYELWVKDDQVALQDNIAEIFSSLGI